MTLKVKIHQRFTLSCFDWLTREGNKHKAKIDTIFLKEPK